MSKSDKNPQAAPQSQQLDTDGDGNPDIEVRALAAAQAQSAPAKAAAPAVEPKIVDGTEAIKADLQGEFQRQKSERHFRITIHETGAPNEVKRVFVGVNGVPYTILRGHSVVVPEAVVNVLKDAKETKYRKTGKKNELGVDELEPYDVPSYPFQLEEVFAPGEQPAQ